MTDPVLPILGKAAGSTAGRIAPSLLRQLTLRWRVARAVTNLAQRRGWTVERRVLRRSIKRKEIFEELLESGTEQYPALRKAAQAALVRPRDECTTEQLVTLIAEEFVRRLPVAESGRAHMSRQIAKVRRELRDFADTLQGFEEPARSPDGYNSLSPRNGDVVSNLHLIPRTIGLVIREDVEARCREVFAASKLLVVTGPPGNGKSVTAAQLALSSAQSIRWWIDGHSEESIEFGVNSLLRALGLRAQPASVDELRRVVSAEEDMLLVVDNVVDAKLFYALIPAQLKATIIATTTNPLIGDEVNGVPVGPLTPAQGNELFRSLAFGLSDDDASIDGVDKLTEALGQSPLAIRQAAAYLRVSGMSPLALRDRLATSPRRVLSFHAPPDYPEPIARVHELAREAVVRQERAAKDVLTLVALSGPGGISYQLLSVCETKRPEELQLSQALAALSQAGLAQISAGRVTCHSLTAAFEQESVRPWRRRALARRVVAYAAALGSKGELEDIDVALSALVPLLDEAKVRGHRDKYYRSALLIVALKRGRPQSVVSLTRSLREALARTRENDPDIPVLLLLEADYLTTLGYPRIALARADEAATRSAASGDSATTVQALVVASHCQSQLGDREESIRLLQQAVSTSPASDHGTREQLYLQIARYEVLSAEPAEQADQLLKLRERVDTGTAEWALLSSLAGRALAKLGKGERAVELTKEALALDRELFSEVSLPVARDMNDLGQAYITLANLDEAENWLERSRKIYRTIGDGDHSHMGIPTLHLGRIAFIRAQASKTDEDRDSLLADATALLEEAVRLNSAEGAEGTELADAFVALGDTFLCSSKREDHVVALDYFTRAAAIDSRELGVDHAEVAVDSLRQAMAHLLLGNHAAMAKVLDRVDVISRGDRGFSEVRVETTYLRILFEFAGPAPNSTRVRQLARRLIRFERNPELSVQARAQATQLIDQTPGLRALAELGPTAPRGASFFRDPRLPDASAAEDGTVAE